MCHRSWTSLHLANQVEWTTESNFGINETKLVTLLSDIPGDTDGQFRLRFGGEATYPLRHDASADEVREALEALVTVAEVHVSSATKAIPSTMDPSGLLGSLWTITFFGATGPLPKAGFACTACVSAVSNITDANSAPTMWSLNVTDNLIGVLREGERVLLSAHYADATAYNSPCELMPKSVEEYEILAWELPGSRCHEVGGSHALLALKFLSSSGLFVEDVDLRSISGKGTISTFVTELLSGTYPDVYGYAELRDETGCDISQLGPSSSVQRLVLFAGSKNSSATIVTAGSYRLALAEHLTECVAFNATPKELESALEGLPSVQGRVSVTGRVFVDNGTYYPVSDEELLVTNGLGYDYLIRFWGAYASKNGAWPQLRVPPEYFGRNAGGDLGCDLFASPENTSEPSSEVVMLGEGPPCIDGNQAAQVILAEASSPLGGSFSLRRLGGGEHTIPLASTAADMESLLSRALKAPINVTQARYGQYSKAWIVRFPSSLGEVARLTICDRFTTGSSAAVGVYDVVEITTSAANHEGTSGHFRLLLNGEASDLVSFNASDGRLDSVLQTMRGVGKVTTLSPIYPGGEGGVSISPLTVFNNSQSAVTPGDLTKKIAPGDAVHVASVEGQGQFFELSSVSYSKDSDTTTLTLNHTVKNLISDNMTSSAIVGTAASSRSQLTGRARLVSTVSVMYSYPNMESAARVLELSEGGVQALNISLGSTIAIDGQQYMVDDYREDQVILSRDFVGPTVVGGDIDLKVFGTSMNVTFTRDVTSITSVGDKIWIENKDGDVDELVVAEIFPGEAWLRLSGVFSCEYHGASAYTRGNGRKWILAFKQTHADLSTFQLEPEADWRGLGATIRVQRPGGIPPLTATLGSLTGFQTVTFRSSKPWWSPQNKMNNGTWSLVLWPEDGQTPELAWGASAREVQSALERFSAISRVEVDRQGDGQSAEWFYGYAYSFTFWGVHNTARLPQLTVKSSLRGITVHVDTVRQGAALASHSPTLVALKEGTTYSIRASSWTAGGYGPASPVHLAETPLIGVIPGPPTGTTLGACQYSSTSLGMQWKPPLREGGQRVDGYRVEWDRLASILETNAAYGTDYLQVIHEVQEILVNFRSGDSVATRGGTFAVSWGGHSTADLPWDSPASALETAILGISGVQEIAVNPVSVTRAPYRNGYKWTVTFMAWRGDLALLRGDGTLLVGDDPSVEIREKVAGRADIFPGDFTNEVQAVTVSSLSQISGTFTLAFEGKVIGPIAHNEGAESLKNKLEAIDTIFCVDVERFEIDKVLSLYGWHVTLSWLDGEVVPGAGNLGLFTVDSTADLLGNSANVGVYEIVSGTNPLQYTIPNLITGVQYFAHVAAHNSRGFGPFSAITTGTTRGQPGAPVSISVASVSGSAIECSWQPPSDNGGAAITGYTVDWHIASDAGTREVQMITTSSQEGVSEVQIVSIKADANNLGGYFALSFAGISTGNIAWDAPAAGVDSLKEKLERLSAIGEVDVARDYSRSAVSGLRVDVVVGSSNASASNTSSILPSQSGLAVNDIIFLAGHRARVLGFSPDGENILLGSMRDYTVPYAFNQEFGAEGVIVEKWAYGYEYLVTFTSYNGDAPLMIASASDGWSGTNPVIDVGEVTPGLQPISGSFRLRFEGENTPPIPHDASAQDIESNLEGLIGVEDVSVSKVVNGYGYNWIVTFDSGVGNVDLIEADGTGLTGPSASVSVSAGQDGARSSSYGWQKIVDASVLHFTVQGLKLGEPYTVRVRACNSEGCGTAGTANPAMIRPLQPPGIPEDVSLIVMSDSMLKVVWSAPLSNGGNAISQYRVDWDIDEEFSNIATSGFYHILSVVNAEGPFFYNIVLPAASSWLPRYARVRAYNSFAWGLPGIPEPASAQPALRPPGEPQDVELAVTSGVGLLVSWTAPSTNLIVFGGDGGSTIQEYLLEWDTSAKFDSPARRAVVTMPSALRYLIGGRDLMTGEESTELEPSVTYYVRISAFNAEGYGAVVSTTPAYATTQDQVSAPPDMIGAETVGSSSIAGLVEVPSRDGGDTLIKYRLEWDVSEDFSHINGSSRAGGWKDVPLVQEVQSFAVSSSVAQEEQWIVATVEVTNERQTVRTQVRF